MSHIGSYELRWYQDEAIGSLFDYFKKERGNPNIALPTGTGKSLVIAGFTQQALERYPQTRIMCLVDSKLLVDQNAQKLLTIWPQAPVGVYSAGLDRRDTHYRITFAGIQSVAEKAHVFGHIDLVIIDESHMVDWREKTRYYTFINALLKKNPKLKVIGLTATPWRSGIGNIEEGGLFTHRCYSRIGVEDFIRFVEDGFLSPLYPLRTQTHIDLTGVSTVAGEFNQSELQEASDREKITRAAIAESLDLAGDRKCWLVFCTGVKHVENTVRYLREAGISAMGVHSKQNDGANDLAVSMYQDGKIRALVNMGVLTKGFDAPETDYIMMLRATQSSILWVQMLGRGTRVAPWSGKKDCLVGDFARNAKRLGPINDPVIPRKKGEKKAGGDMTRPCGKCGCENHISKRFCERCGEPFPEPQEKLKAIADNTDLMAPRSKAKEKEDNGVPEVAIFPVEYVSYTLHVKPDKPSMVKVTYSCGYRMFNEYLCFEHTGFARHKAHKWWKRRFGSNSLVPETCDQVLEESALIQAPTHIRVWVNKQFPEIMDYCFDGSAFGQPEVVANVERPSINLAVPTYDDIPF
jgi:DNA repair protein RadD